MGDANHVFWEGIEPGLPQCNRLRLCFGVSHDFKKLFADIRTTAADIREVFSFVCLDLGRYV